MNADFEKNLRESAPAHTPREDHRRQLRLILMGKLEPSKRSRSLPLLLAAALLAALMVTLAGTQLGGSGFHLDIKTPKEGLLRVFTSPLGNLRIKTSGSPEDPLQERQALEKVWEQDLARRGVFEGVTGWTVEGVTVFLVDYAYVIEGRTEIQTRMAHYPDTGPLSREAAESIFNYSNKVGDLIASGEAVYVGQENRIVDGYAIRFEKWAIPAQTGLATIYWRGGLIE